MVARYRIEWLPADGSGNWEDTFQALDDLTLAHKIAHAWLDGRFTYVPPANVKIIDTKENKIVSILN